MSRSACKQSSTAFSQKLWDTDLTAVKVRFAAFHKRLLVLPAGREGFRVIEPSDLRADRTQNRDGLGLHGEKFLQFCKGQLEIAARNRVRNIKRLRV